MWYLSKAFIFNLMAIIAHNSIANKKKSHLTLSPKNWKKHGNKYLNYSTSKSTYKAALNNA